MDLMIDIETMSSRPNAAVASIGAVAFDPMVVDTVDSIHPTRKFEVILNLENQKNRHFDPNTIYWWLTQSAMSRAAITVADRRDVSAALVEFISWYEDLNIGNVWCYGATFDHVVLVDLFRDYQLTYPVHYRNQLCARTFLNIFPVDRPKLELTGHSALDDAILQTIWLQQAFAALRAKINK